MDIINNKETRNNKKGKHVEHTESLLLTKLNTKKSGWLLIIFHEQNQIIHHLYNFFNLI